MIHVVVNGSALAVYPSLMEGFGLPAAEAMASGTPILCADAASLPEVVPRAECCFDPTAQEALAQKLRITATAPETYHCHLPEAFTEAHAAVRYKQILRARFRVSE
jgi:glycosyltransferase involved in cell wall biosynthesis